MTINDIMMRDMAEEERRMRREQENAEYDREIMRRMRRRRLRAVGDLLASLALIAAAAAFCWVCCEVSGYHWE